VGEAGGTRVRRRHSARPMGSKQCVASHRSEQAPTAFAFTSTDTRVEGRLTRQFLSDCFNATSAWTTLPAGFLGGMAVDVRTEASAGHSYSMPLVNAGALPPSRGRRRRCMARRWQNRRRRQPIARRQGTRSTRCNASQPHCQIRCSVPLHYTATH
jgi:hypothetical protein